MTQNDKRIEAAAVVSDEVLVNAVYKSGLSEKQQKPLLITKYKDGIDIDYPSLALKILAEEIATAALSAADAAAWRPIQEPRRPVEYMLLWDGHKEHIGAFRSITDDGEERVSRQGYQDRFGNWIHGVTHFQYLTPLTESSHD